MKQKLALWWWNSTHGGWIDVLMWFIALLVVLAVLGIAWEARNFLLILQECCCG